MTCESITLWNNYNFYLVIGEKAKPIDNMKFTFVEQTNAKILIEKRSIGILDGYLRDMESESELCMSWIWMDK